MTDSSMVVFSQASKMLAEANTIQKAKELKDLAITAAEWAKRKGMGEEAVNFAKSYALDAERKMGEMLIESPRARGGKPKTKKKDITPNSTLEVRQPTLDEIGITYRESSEAQKLAALPEEKFEAIKSGEKTRAAAKREIQKEKNDAIKQELEPIPGLFDVIVIDPPWPVKKIEREVRPNQVEELEYPTMTIEEINLIEIPANKDCHIFLWTTQKFLPIAFEILQAWGTHYVCTFTWHKPGGFQPFNLPQYNSEFCLYARIGSPEFSDTKNFFTCFDAPRGKHSEKPEEFYQTVARVTTGARLDMFNRRKIDGFEGWGFESK